MHVCVPGCLVLAEASRVHQTLGVTSSCELACGCWKRSPDLEQQVFLPTEPVLQPQSNTAHWAPNPDLPAPTFGCLESQAMCLSEPFLGDAGDGTLVQCQRYF